MYNSHAITRVMVSYKKRITEMKSFPLLSDVEVVVITQCNSLCISDAAVGKPVV